MNTMIHDWDCLIFYKNFLSWCLLKVLKLGKNIPDRFKKIYFLNFSKSPDFLKKKLKQK